MFRWLQGRAKRFSVKAFVEKMNAPRFLEVMHVSLLVAITFLAVAALVSVVWGVSSFDLVGANALSTEFEPFFVPFKVPFLVISFCAFVLILTGFLKSNFDVGFQAVGRSPNGEPRLASRIRSTVVASDCDEQWLQFNSPAEVANDLRVICVGSTSHCSRMPDLAQKLLDQNTSVDIVNDMDATLDAIRVSPSGWGLMLVDLDHVTCRHDMEDVVGELMQFRKDCPWIAIILLSSSFLKDDSGITRLSIADYCLRSSVSNSKILSVFDDVWRNHNDWVARRSNNT